MSAVKRTESLKMIEMVKYGIYKKTVSELP